MVTLENIFGEVSLTVGKDNSEEGKPYNYCFEGDEKRFANSGLHLLDLLNYYHLHYSPQGMGLTPRNSSVRLTNNLPDKERELKNAVDSAVASYNSFVGRVTDCETELDSIYEEQNQLLEKDLEKLSEKHPHHNISIGDSKLTWEKRAMKVRKEIPRGCL